MYIQVQGGRVDKYDYPSGRGRVKILEKCGLKKSGQGD
jgi:hypothetical protein